METAIVSVVCMALIVIGGMTMSQNFLSSADTASRGIQQLTTRDEARLKTGITPVSVSLQEGKVILITLRNTGQLKLADFDHWDVIVQYYEQGGNARVTWLPYVSGTPGNNQWGNDGIYISYPATPEVFEPGILNAVEEIRIRAVVNPEVGHNTNNQVVISTPNGVSATVAFSRN